MMGGGGISYLRRNNAMAAGGIRNEFLGASNALCALIERLIAGGCDEGALPLFGPSSLLPPQKSPRDPADQAG
jgi:hypothetical protein